MIYQLIGTGIHNQGAELMACAVASAVNHSPLPGPVIAEGIWTPEALRRNGLDYYKEIRGRIRGPLCRWLLKPEVRKAFGIHGRSDITCIFDASGFAYSSQWHIKLSEALLLRIEKANEKRIPYILLPQAFGPFDDAKISRCLKVALSKATLVYARENTSYDHLKQILGDAVNLRIAPDFTSIIHGMPSPISRTVKDSCLIIPNQRMIDKTERDKSNLYLTVLEQLIKVLIKSINVIILCHSNEDYEIALKLSDRGNRINIINERDPRVTKNIIACSKFVIGSRFHGLQSSLSEGIPAYALGWSHKYEELYNDYKWDDGILDLSSKPADIVSKILKEMNDENYSTLRCLLRKNSDALKVKTFNMWDEIFTRLHTFNVHQVT